MGERKRIGILTSGDCAGLNAVIRCGVSCYKLWLRCFVKPLLMTAPQVMPLEIEKVDSLQLQAAQY